MKIRRNFKVLLLLLLAVAPVYAKKIENGEQVVAAMHKRYAGNWYKTLTFVQKNTEYKPDGTTQNSIWYEALSSPGKLRIDFDPLETGNGLMFADGMQHNFKDGKLAGSQPLIHPLLVLGFDVYTQPVEKTISQLKELKMDLAIMHEDVWQGKDVYVVGAKQGDLRSPQFWIDKKNLYFVRMLQPVGKNKDRLQETQFNKYQKVKGGGWVSPEVVFMIDGKRNWMEEYSDIQTDVALDANLFNTQSWAKVDRKYFLKK
jgi:outer membrane lipoprotein-sorting protein